MSAAEKDALLRKKQRFDRLTDEEQQRMRRLHTAINSHQESERLKQVLASYNQWLKTLTASERAKLLGLPADERIEQIKKLRQQQQGRTFGLLGDRSGPPGDIELLFQWAVRFVQRHDRELLANLPVAFREQIVRADPRRRQRMLLFAMIGLFGRRHPRQELPLPDQDELRRLSEALSQKARQILANEEDLQWRAVIQRGADQQPQIGQGVAIQEMCFVQHQQLGAFDAAGMFEDLFVRAVFAAARNLSQLGHDHFEDAGRR